MENFNGFGLAAPLVTALTKMGYAKPTPIQADAIPVLMQGRDLIGIAQTGTGKTAAFALPILNRLIADKRPAPRGGARVLVLTPTRELASQIAQSFRDLSAGLPLDIAVVFGGVPHGAQIRALTRGLDVLVATPGRLVDHLDARVANLSGVEFFVLDEVDRMLDLGFIKPIRRVVRELPRKRQNLFFSATMPPDIRKLAGELLREPAEVSVTPSATTVDLVEQMVIHVDAPRKRDMLAELFADPKLTRTIVFTRTKHGADRVAKCLDEAGISALAIHGNKSQGQRERALAAFRSGQARALVATDIAARGIDIDDVSHVVNFELPEVAEAYVHRIGRTARAGKGGKAISLCDASEREIIARDRASDAVAHLFARPARRQGAQTGAGRAQGRGEAGAGPGAPSAPTRPARGEPAAAPGPSGPPRAAGLSSQQRAGVLTGAAGQRRREG